MQQVAQDFGYHFTHCTLNTAEHGLPHSRTRTFMLPVKQEHWNGSFAWPLPMPCPSIESLLDRQPLQASELEERKPTSAATLKA